MDLPDDSPKPPIHCCVNVRAVLPGEDIVPYCSSPDTPRLDAGAHEYGPDVTE